jgi:hypothetical protein
LEATLGFYVRTGVSVSKVGSLPASRKTRRRSRRAEFGSGHAPATYNGTDHIRRVFSLAWEKRRRRNRRGGHHRVFAESYGDAAFLFTRSPAVPRRKDRRVREGKAVA